MNTRFGVAGQRDAEKQARTAGSSATRGLRVHTLALLVFVIRAWVKDAAIRRAERASESATLRRAA